MKKINAVPNRGVVFASISELLSKSNDARQEKLRKKPVDLEYEKKLGLELAAKLRELYPEITADPRCKRSHAWANCWYLSFDLGFNVKEAARKYADENSENPWPDPSAVDMYWKYINDFQDKCNEIAHGPKYYNEDVQCSVEYISFQGGSSAELTVFSLRNKV